MNREDMRKLFAPSEGGAAEAPAEQPEASVEAPTSYREVGMARLNGMRNTVSGWQTKLDAMAKSFGEKAGRFSAGAQKFGMDSLAVALSADKWVEAGAQRTGAAISAGVEAVEDGATRFNAAVSGGFETAANAVEGGLSAGVDAASAWAARKAARMATIGQQTVNITEMLAIGAKNKTEEALTGAADAIGNGYNTVRQYGAGAIEMAKVAGRGLLERTRAKMNEIALRNLENKEKFHSAKVIEIKDAIARKQGLATSVNQEFAMAA